MFPWVDGFHWTATHIIFLSLFFSALLVILSTVVSAIWHVSSDFRTHRAAEMCWHGNFEELPEAERRCRHQLAGRVAHRTCDNAFDCRSCVNYPQFAALPANAPLKVSRSTTPTSCFIIAATHGSARNGMAPIRLGSMNLPIT